MLKKYVYLSFMFMFSLILVAPTAFAAKPDHAGGSKPGGGGGSDSGGTSSLIGYDISYPQCGRSIPTGAFGIVGVNDGYTTGSNPCFGAQLNWAFGSTGTIAEQDKAQLYVNTANPGEVLEQYGVTSWPTDNVDSREIDTLNNVDERLRNPYGACVETQGAYLDSTNSMACSWQYGWNRAVETVDDFFKPGAISVNRSDNPADYVWWLDVETMNSWQGENDNSSSPDYADKLARNTATLEAMKAFYESEGVSKVGIYSTSYQWGRITGKTVENRIAGQNLRDIPSWLAGARSEKDARKRCSTSSALTPGGTVALVQYVSKNLDHNVSCL